MGRLATSFVLGYHGCDATFAEQLVAGRATMDPSKNDWDWLGKGAYFWESDPLRAFEWAVEQTKNPKSRVKSPAVVGAAIDLGNCLDLTSRVDIELVRDAHRDMVEVFGVVGLALPVNLPGHDMKVEDLHLRKLDNAVINFLHDRMRVRGAPFDTARAPFLEGDEIYGGAKFYHKTHVQIAVLNAGSVKGYFYPPDYTPPKTKVLAASLLP